MEGRRETSNVICMALDSDNIHTQSTTIDRPGPEETDHQRRWLADRKVPTSNWIIGQGAKHVRPQFNPPRDPLVQCSLLSMYQGIRQGIYPEPLVSPRVFWHDDALLWFQFVDNYSPLFSVCKESSKREPFELVDPVASPSLPDLTVRTVHDLP